MKQSKQALGKDRQAYVGQSVIKKGGRALVTGRAAFSEDCLPGDALVLKAFRSDRHHARILKIDCDRAGKCPGVAAVFTAADIPGVNQYGVIVKDQPLLADQKVRFKGEAVALVAARTEAAAQQALEQIRVTYQDLPPVLDPEQALGKTAPAIHDTGNLLNRKTVKKGDVEKGFRQSDIIVSHTYNTQLAEHSYLEPDAGWGTLDDTGGITIWVCTQNPHYDQRDVASLLAREPSEIRIIQTATGGGFGSKLDLSVQGFIALAVHHLKQPVKMLFSREEVYLATSKRHPSRIRLKTGISKDGRLQAMQADMLFDTGPYSSYGTPLAMRAAIHITGPYDVPHVDVTSASVYTNNPVAGAMRGVAIVQTTAACESQMDILADKAGIDPLKFRKMNAFRPGSVTATRQRLTHSVGILKTLEALDPAYEKALEWKRKQSDGPVRRGVGLGSMWYGIGSMSVKNPSHATIKADRPDRVILYTGAADIGQGSCTVLCQIAREVLGVDPGFLELRAADTGETLDASPTSASRQTYVSGNAVMDAAENMAKDLIARAALKLGVSPDTLFLKDAWVKDRQGNNLMTITDLLDQMIREQGPLVWEGYFDPETTSLDPETGEGIPFATYTFATHLVTAEVDTRTGRVHLEHVTAAQDVGRAVNPQGVQGQIHGGVGMGIGFGLMEEFLPGKTVSMSQYHIPTSMDMPPIDAIIIEDPEPTGPFGAKGMGEPSLAPTAPAILNAVADATGARVFRLPAEPEAVRRVLNPKHYDREHHNNEPQNKD
jgi:CO/xanthine dehydrogenase Mo-binding subunit